MLERYDDYFTRFRAMKAVARNYVCEGPYVTLLWDIDMEATDGKVTTISSIEIFKVVDGKITDCSPRNGRLRRSISADTANRGNME